MEQDVSLNSNVEISNNLTVNNLLDASGIIVNNKLNTDILEVSNIIITNKFTHNNIYSFRLNGTEVIEFNPSVGGGVSLTSITGYFNSYNSSLNYITSKLSTDIVSNIDSSVCIIQDTGIYNVNLLINWIVVFDDLTSIDSNSSFKDFEFSIRLGVKKLGENINIYPVINRLYKIFSLTKPSDMITWNAKTSQNFNQNIYLNKDDELRVYIEVDDYIPQNIYQIKIDFSNSYFGVTEINSMTIT